MIRKIAIAASLAILSAMPYAGAQTAPSKPDISTEIVVGDAVANDAFSRWIGVQVRLGPGWKTYWKAPGDTGQPPEFDWSSSFNVAGAEVYWPVPHRASILGVESLGYTSEVLFPVKVQIEDPDYDAKAELKLVLYACSTICVREERILKADLSRPSSANAQTLIDEWRDRIPKERSASLAIKSIALLRSTPPKLQVEASSTSALESPDLFIAGAAGLYAGRPEVTFAHNRAILTSILEGDIPAQLDPAKVTVTLVDGARAVESAISPGAVPQPSLAADDPATWLTIIGTALIGGFVLNLMPCVFPVLSLKLIGFSHQGGGNPSAFRANLLASAAGVVVSFLVLATAIAALKASGESIGWGIQFQHPLFLMAMAAAIALFAANLLGFFEITLPPRLMTALSQRDAGQSIPSHFASGFVATLLATPCSAPFVGTAVGFALSRGTFEIYSVFAALGIGMAAPYLAAACVPHLATHLPRPGRWMLWLKRAMGIALLATAAWLITLVGATAGVVTAAFAGAALIFGLFVVWWRSNAPSLEAIVAAYAVILLVAASGIFMLAQTSDVNDVADEQAVTWHEFGELDRLVHSGRTVFLDITAAWCVTCKVNKTLVVNDQVITRRLSRDVVAVRADWTRPDPRIAEYLKSFGRYGLPFNVVFGPGAPTGIVLPELLTISAVLTAFEKSANTQPSIESK